MPTINTDSNVSKDVLVKQPHFGFWRVVIVSAVYIWCLAIFGSFLVPFLVGFAATLLISFKYFEQRLVLTVHQLKVVKKALGVSPPTTKDIISRVVSGLFYLLIGTLFFYAWGIALLSPSWCWFQQTMEVKLVSVKVCKAATNEFGAFLSHPNGNY